MRPLPARRRTFSANASRHGLCATPPSARRASLILSPSSSSAAATDSPAGSHTHPAQNPPEARVAQSGNEKPWSMPTGRSQVQYWRGFSSVYRYRRKAKASERCHQTRSQEQALRVCKPSNRARTYFVLAKRIEAINRVSERFSNNHRKALIVQATGTG